MTLTHKLGGEDAALELNETAISNPQKKMTACIVYQGLQIILSQDPFLSSSAAPENGKANPIPKKDAKQK